MRVTLASASFLVFIQSTVVWYTVCGLRTDAPAKRYIKYYPCCKEPYPDIKFYVRLRRRALYYNLYLIVPTLAVAALTLLAFMLPPDSGEKIGLGKHRLMSG